MTATTVVNQLAPEHGERVRAAFPQVRVVDVSVDEPLPADLDAPVVLARASRRGYPFLEQLDERGVEWIHIASTGVDFFPLNAVQGRTVTCSRGASALPISEFVLAVMLAFEKDLPGVWVDEPPDAWFRAELGTLSGRTLGLVGLGAIGSAIAHRALPFGMRVLAARRSDRPSPIEGVEVTTDLDTVLAAADHLVLAAPATGRTRGLLDREALSRVRRGVHVVNVSRGSLIDHEALRGALDDGHVARATLDVTEPEPLPAGHWLYGHPAVRLSPHVSWSSPDGLGPVIEAFLANLGRYLAGERLEGRVDPDEGY